MREFNSVVIATGTTTNFPDFTGERVYMRPFLKAEGLPDDLSRWQPLINDMLRDVETSEPIYLMIDQARLAAGQYHRRPGLHIDGYWHPSGGHWGSVLAHHNAGRPPSHSNNPPPRHSGHRSRSVAWKDADFLDHEGIILASNVSACRAISGPFHGEIGDGGDCSAVDFSAGSSLIMGAGRIYAGNVTMVHETVPVPSDCERSVVRLNVPGWQPGS